ncbi:DUF4214 domain-containing protein [Massilia yuzhufengensis]|uniref:DUF4214 domain-containing protein n=1 Tax=Massilia yuzhufengensis TaxID=1164594 RepID=A0A1I1VPQ6_9BURK|nr:DUF4214 domain-containing protein [Massilia yuzhufengensis]SFD85072.1 protein of unknown function [Massilia yuzhufengensis]
MATDYVNEVQKLYVAYFSRPADPGGLTFWANRLQTNPNGYQNIALAFSSSAEYQATYGNMDNRAVVAEVYENLFGRVGEAAGIDYWTNAWNNGSINIGNVVTGIAAGAQNNDRIAYNAKVGVSTLFTNRIDTNAEIAAYQGVKTQIAVDYIAKVNSFATGATYSDLGLIDAEVARIVGTPTGISYDDMELV